MVHDGSGLKPKVNGKNLQVGPDRDSRCVYYVEGKQQRAFHKQGRVCLLIRGTCKFTAALPKKHACHREFHLGFIRHLDTATSAPGIQEIEEHTKLHSEEGRSQTQKMGNSVGQRI